MIHRLFCCHILPVAQQFGKHCHLQVHFATAAYTELCKIMISYRLKYNKYRYFSSTGIPRIPSSKYKNIIKYKKKISFLFFVFFLPFNFLFSFSLMPSSHCTIFHSPTGFAKSPTNGRNQRQIGARSREWQSRSVNYQRRDLRESPMCRRAVGDSQSCCVNEFWLKHTSAMTYSQWESPIQGSGKFREDFFFFLFIK